MNEVIFTYTRAQAIEDGVLIDVTQQAKEYGFRFPVAVTSAVWEDSVSWDNDTEAAYQDESGRLADILWMALLSTRRTKGSQSCFDVFRIPKGKTLPTSVTLKSVCGPGDTAEPVITIMLPWED